jgi:hypothetical protein
MHFVHRMDLVRHCFCIVKNTKLSRNRDRVISKFEAKKWRRHQGGEMSPPKKENPREESEGLFDIQENHREDCFRSTLILLFSAGAQ